MQHGGLGGVKPVFIVGDENDLEVVGVPNGQGGALAHAVQRDAVDGGACAVNGEANTGRKRRLVQRETRHVVHAQAQVEPARANRRNKKVEAEFTVITGGGAPVVFEITEHHIKRTGRCRGFVF